VLALGGFGHDGTSDRTFDEIWRCELASGQWSVLPARLPAPMTQFRALVHGDELLLVGGMDFERERTPKMKLRDALHAAPLADPAQGFRDTGLRLPAPRRAFGAALVGERLYVAGGLDEAFEAVTSFDVLDLARGTWTTLAPPSEGRLSPELVALDGKLYLCGGLVFDAEGRALPAGTIEEFDPARGAWRTLADPLPLDPREVQAFAWRERLAFISTWNERGVLELALLDPDAVVR
jgi:N-acetylneuraminic acid mutarotase